MKNMDEYMNSLIALFSHMPVWALALIIVIVSVILWRRWAPHITNVQKELVKLREALEKSQDQSPSILKNLAENIQDNNVRALLKETTSGLFELPGDFGFNTYSLRSYQEIWTPRALLAKRVNLSIFEAMPNLLIGVGLMFTFLFLALALNGAQAAMGAQDMKAIEGLLNNAGAKFWTSIAGILCSIVWNYQSKRVIEELDHEIEALCMAFHDIAADTGAENTITTQMQLLTELLSTGQEQIGQLKRFETDFAVAIAKALNATLKPVFDASTNNINTQLSRMTSVLESALDRLSKNMATINEDALRGMIDKFGETMKETTGSQMESFKTTLANLAIQLDSASEKIIQASDTFQTSLLETKACIVDMNDTIERGSSAGNAGAERLEKTLESMAASTQAIDGVMNKVTGIIKEMGDSVDQIAGLGKSMTESVSAQKEVVRVIQDRIPAMREAVQQAVETLQKTASTAGQAFENTNHQFTRTKDSLDNTFSSAQKGLDNTVFTMQKGFENTVGSLHAGITDYTEQIASLHMKLDGLLGAALSKLGSAITNLESIMDDFVESLDEHKSSQGTTASRRN